MEVAEPSYGCPAENGDRRELRSMYAERLEAPVAAESGRAEALAARLHRLLVAYGVGMVVALLVPAVLVFVDRRLGNTRNLQIGLDAVLLVSFAVSRWRAGVAVPWRLLAMPPWLTRTLLGSAVASLVLASLYRFHALHVNGIDFSIFDWMLADARLGRPFMYSPICDCDHFAVHASYVLLPLVPLHAWLRSPLLLLLLQPVLVGLCAIPLWHLGRRVLRGQALVVLLLLSFFTNGWTGALVNYGFHIEVFFLPGGLLLAWGWTTRRRALWVAGVLLFLLTKEDGAVYLVAFGLAAAVFERERASEALLVVAASVGVLALNTLVVQPALAPDGAAGPSYLGFWAQYGSGFGGVIQGMLARPSRVLGDVLSSHWWYLLGSFAFLPLLSPTATAAMVPAMFVLGTAATPLMRRYAAYYPAPMLPFVFWGLLQGLERLGRGRRLRELAPALAFTVFLVAPLTGGGYLRFERPRLDVIRDAHQVARALQASAPGERVACAQTSLFPHLGYGYDLRPLSARCLATPGAVGIADADTPPYPFTRAELARLIEGARERHTLSSGLVVFSNAPVPAALLESDGGIPDDQAPLLQGP